MPVGVTAALDATTRMPGHSGAVLIAVDCESVELDFSLRTEINYLMVLPIKGPLLSLVLGLGGCGDPSAGGGAGSEGDTGSVDSSPVRTLTLERVEYQDRLEALWMAESVANWTGLITEGRHNEPPYLTDADWGGSYEHSRPGTAVNVLDFNFQDPWLSDDDTDIEYVYLAAMTKRGDPYLDGEDIRQSWIDHTVPGEAIWVSNLAAQTLMFDDPAVVPPSTSLFAANDQSLMIDAQLTTELFGALSPGMPRRALALADLPIRTAASGYAVHAAQFHVVLYSLAPTVDATLPLRERTLWLAKAARKFIPDTSKTAVMFDFILADYLANPDVTDWERTRDAVDAKFGTGGPGGGADPNYLYLEWYESPVNFGTGVMALLYGEGDLRQTIRIGALSGWDSDNGTATMGGLLGLMLGTQAIRDQFPEVTISNRYQIVTRVGFDPIDDTFEAIAARMAPLADRIVADGGGSTEAENLMISLENLETVDARIDNPGGRDLARSLNNAVRTAGQEPGVALIGTDVVQDGDLPGYSPASSLDLGILVDGLEFDSSGSDRRLAARTVETFPDTPMAPRHVALKPTSGVITIEITYPDEYAIAGIRFVEGPPWMGEPGGLENVIVRVRRAGEWSTVALATPYDPRPERAFNIHELKFETAISADAIRLEGAPLDASAAVVTLCEVEGMLAP